MCSSLSVGIVGLNRLVRLAENSNLTTVLACASQTAARNPEGGQPCLMETSFRGRNHRLKAQLERMSNMALRREVDLATFAGHVPWARCRGFPNGKSRHEKKFNFSWSLDGM